LHVAHPVLEGESFRGVHSPISLKEDQDSIFVRGRAQVTDKMTRNQEGLRKGSEVKEHSHRFFILGKGPHRKGKIILLKGEVHSMGGGETSNLQGKIYHLLSQRSNIPKERMYSQAKGLLVKN